MFPENFALKLHFKTMKYNVAYFQINSQKLKMKSMMLFLDLN